MATTTHNANRDWPNTQRFDSEAHQAKDLIAEIGELVRRFRNSDTSLEGYHTEHDADQMEEVVGHLRMALDRAKRVRL